MLGKLDGYTFLQPKSARRHYYVSWHCLEELKNPSTAYGTNKQLPPLASPLPTQKIKHFDQRTNENVAASVWEGARGTIAWHDYLMRLISRRV